VSCQSSADDVFACLLLAVGLFGTSLVPFFLLVNSDHLTPKCLRQAPLSAAALLMLLTAPTKGALR
jgi:hypothetical protein